MVSKKKSIIKSKNELSSDELSSIKIFLFKLFLTIIVIYILINLSISKIERVAENISKNFESLNQEIKSDISFNKLLKEIQTAADNPIDPNIKKNLIINLKKIKEDIKPILDILNE